MEYTVWTIAPIILLPFLGFVLSAFLGNKLPRGGDFLGIGSVFLSFFYTAGVFLDFVFGKYADNYYVHKVFRWFDLSYPGYTFNLDIGIYLDNMSVITLFMVTGVGSLIMLFSSYYMKGDVRYGRFFTYMSLFTTGMIGFVLADNLLVAFMFWELMGFCSYSLIGFYFEKEKAGYASIKAFMTTRVGDVFFLLGIVALWTQIGSVAYVDIYSALANTNFSELTILGIPYLTFTALALFMGTIGKSAQFPLQVWLPDAMMGPTPCSAMIHAATMVAAGVFLSLRMYPVMEAGNITTFIAYIGAITAFGAATIALVQTDIKAVMAYSTISQLGYMVLGIGVGAYNAAFMHLITHAVFKACLFLSAGSVIHSLHDHHTHAHVQDMMRMGGLRKKLPFTFLAMTCCTLAISGVPFFSGFVSKDRILGDALFFGMQNPMHSLVPFLGFSAAFLTAFYMCRMMFLTFFGAPKDQDVYDHCHKEKLQINRNVPLLILSLFTLGLFYSGSMTGQGIVKVFSGKYEWFKTLVRTPDTATFSAYEKSAFGRVDTTSNREFTRSSYETGKFYAGMSEHDAHMQHSAHVYGAILSIILAFLGIFFAFSMYIKKMISPSFWVQTFSPWYHALREKYYFDHFYIDILIKKCLLTFNSMLAYLDMDLYDRWVVDGQQYVARFFYKINRWFDDVIVDSVAVDGVGTTVKLGNVVLRIVQSGKIQFYFIVLITVLTGYIVSISI